MKHTLLFVLLLIACTTTAQTKDSALVRIKQSPEPRYIFVLSESVINKLFEIVDASDEPYATVRKPLKELFIYQLQHQPIADTSKIKKP